MFPSHKPNLLVNASQSDGTNRRRCAQLFTDFAIWAYVRWTYRILEKGVHWTMVSMVLPSLGSLIFQNILFFFHPRSTYSQSLTREKCWTKKPLTCSLRASVRYTRLDRHFNRTCQAGWCLQDARMESDTTTVWASFKAYAGLRESTSTDIYWGEKAYGSSRAAQAKLVLLRRGSWKARESILATRRRPY